VDARRNLVVLEIIIKSYKHWAQFFFGLSTQSTEYQQEAAYRLHLPFELLSDSELNLMQAL
jgi:peroxiredoxin